MKAHVRMHTGTPTLFLDGQPVFANFHLLLGMDDQARAANQDCVRAFAAQGVHLHALDPLSAEWCGPRPGNPSPFDFSRAHERIQMVLEADPEALLLLRLGIETRHLPGDWWNQAYPDEREVLTDGPVPSASFASQVWQTQVKEFLRAYIAFLRSAGLYDRVIAYQICTGTCGEWIKSWSSMEEACGDFSAPMQRAFGGWLRQRYHDDIGALQAAWADPGVTFETAAVPSTAEQSTTAHYLFRDPRREQRVIDYYACYAETTADALLGFCHTVKEETGGDKLAGAFFGYIMEIAWNDGFFGDGAGGAGMSGVSAEQRSGHLGLWKALRSPDIDFFVSPYTYEFRGYGGDGLSMQPSEALRAHGKLYLLEEDTLMHNNFDPGGRMHPVDKVIPIYQRHFAEVATHGQGITWLESHHFPESPRIRGEAHRWQRRFQELGTWALQLDRTPQAEVAVFIDDESFFYETIRNNIGIPLLWHQRVISLNRFGAPHDLYLLNDLLGGGGAGDNSGFEGGEAGDKPGFYERPGLSPAAANKPGLSQKPGLLAALPEYKLYVFLNPFHLNDERRKRLQEIVCRGGKTALWLYAAGYINTDRGDAAVSLDNMTDLTGFHFGAGKSYWGPFMHITDFSHPITRGVPQDLFWGSTSPIAPNLYIDDPHATVLGEAVSALGRCRAGLGVKTFNAGDPANSWTSVYCATPNIAPAVLRGIARFAGVHLYNEEGDVLYATPDLLGVHTVGGGPRVFRLPRQVEVVFDLFNGRELARDATGFTDELPPASTALYYTGTMETLRALPGGLPGD